MRTTIPDESAAVGPEAPDATLTDAGHDEAEPIDARRSRQSFVFFGALAAAALLPKRARAQSRQKGKRPIDTEPKNGFAEVIPRESVAAFEEWDTGTSRLVRRVTLGMTQGELQRAPPMGWQGYINYQLNYTRIDDSAVEAARHALSVDGPSGDVAFSADAGQVRQATRRSRRSTARAFSQRQLYQRMVEFWTDHFSQCRQGRLPAGRRPARRDSQTCAGQVPAICSRRARTFASMMVYLDQNASTTARPTRTTRARSWSSTRWRERRVHSGRRRRAVARAHGLDGDRKGMFMFNPAIHDRRRRRCSASTIPAGSPTRAGRHQGRREMLDMLANHPSTATFIATKMLKWWSGRTRRTRRSPRSRPSSRDGRRHQGRWCARSSTTFGYRRRR